ncbi:hypothetical protein BMS3Abin17_01171 [archaeon BMS3Abin17]|nr:hypothetical protein BMS3Abin17_01171 [archaeon BMS3Abin17]
MVRFACKNCNYRFNSEVNHTEKKCPYCGKKDVIKEPSAEELLKEE